MRRQKVPDVDLHPCAVFAKTCMELTIDAYENTKNAVAVLDDLLNYDKIQTGTLKLEVGHVRVWDMVRKTTLQFKLQAQNKRIALHTCIQKPELPRPPKQHLTNNEDNGVDHDNNNNNNDAIDIVDDETGEVIQYKQINVLGDGMKLSQALRNLLSNALKFTPEGGTVTVSASYVADGLPKAKPLAEATTGPYASYPRSGSVCIRVQDTGVGISSDQLKLLFQEWVQFDANKLQKGGGSGLGLCITKGIIEQHGGTITAESSGLGKGSTFIMELPLYEFPLEDTVKAQKAPSNRQEDETTRIEDSADCTLSSTATTSDHLALAAVQQPMQHRILVVEDVIANRKLLVRRLERAGHKCGVASNGQEAIDCYLADKKAAADAAAAKHDDLLFDEVDGSGSCHQPFDTILMDSEMPVLTGPEATQRLRQLGCTAAIVGVTGNVLPSDVQFFRSQGADAVLPKPLDIALLDEFWANKSSSKDRLTIKA